MILSGMLKTNPITPSPPPPASLPRVRMFHIGGTADRQGDRRANHGHDHDCTDARFKPSCAGRGGAQRARRSLRCAVPGERSCPSRRYMRPHCFSGVIRCDASMCAFNTSRVSFLYRGRVRASRSFFLLFLWCRCVVWHTRRVWCVVRDIGLRDNDHNLRRKA